MATNEPRSISAYKMKSVRCSSLTSAAATCGRRSMQALLVLVAVEVASCVQFYQNPVVDAPAPDPGAVTT